MEKFPWGLAGFSSGKLTVDPNPYEEILFPNPVLQELLAQAGVRLRGAAGAVLQASSCPPPPGKTLPSSVGQGGWQPQGLFCGRLCWSALLRLCLLALAWEFLPQTNHHLCYPYRRGHRPSIILPS